MFQSIIRYCGIAGGDWLAHAIAIKVTDLKSLFLHSDIGRRNEHRFKVVLSSFHGGEHRLFKMGKSELAEQTVHLQDERFQNASGQFVTKFSI